MGQIHATLMARTAKILLAGCVAAGLVIIAVGPSYSQQRKPDAEKKLSTKKEQGKKPPAPERAPPPYEKSLFRLAEIMGALSYLHIVCQLPDRQVWRQSMAQLLAAEAKTDKQRARLAGAYNNGFRGFEYSYRTCTDNARLVISRYLKEGEKIAQDIANRYGGG